MYTDQNCKACNETIQGSAFQKGVNQGQVKVAGMTLNNVFAVGVAVCPHCGGVQTQGAISEDTALRLVDYTKFGPEGPEGSAVYFDFDVLPRSGRQYRVHGWANNDTKVMTQAG